MGQFQYERRFTRRRGDAEKGLAENLSMFLTAISAPRLRASA